MKNRYRRKRHIIRRRHTGLSGSIWGPILKLAGAIIGVAAACALLTFIVMFVLEAAFKVDTPLGPGGLAEKFANLFDACVEEPFIVSPTPYYTPKPTATPHPMERFSGGDEEKEIVLPAELSFQWLGDPYCFNNKIICSAGKLVDGRVLMNTLIEYDIASGNIKELDVKPTNDHILFPVFNENWLVYFDAHFTTGGNICIKDLKKSGSEPVIVKEVYVGQPEIKLDGDYIAWLERTGSDRDKIFVCHIPTLESTTVQYFNKSSYGTSMPYLNRGRIVWAAEDDSEGGEGGVKATLKYVDLNNSTISEFHTGTYVHDPEYNGRYYAWLNAHHDENTGLYIYDGTGRPKAVDKGVVEFGISEEYVAYGKNEAIWVYLFETDRIYRITPEREAAQFLGVSGGYIMWMDVTTRDRDIIKYVKLPVD